MLSTRRTKGVKALVVASAGVCSTWRQDEKGRADTGWQVEGGGENQAPEHGAPWQCLNGITLNFLLCLLVMEQRCKRCSVPVYSTRLSHALYADCSIASAVLAALSCVKHSMCLSPQLAQQTMFFFAWKGHYGGAATRLHAGLTRSTAVGPRGRAGRARSAEPVPARAAGHRAQRGAAGGVWQGLSLLWWAF